MAVPHRRLETDLFRSAYCRFVQAVPKSANHPQHANVTRGFQYDFQQHLSFDACPARIVGVSRSRLRENLRRYYSSWRLRRFRADRLRDAGRIRVTESSLTHDTISTRSIHAPASITGRNSISKPRARYHPARSLCSSSAIPIPGSSRKIK